MFLLKKITGSSSDKPSSNPNDEKDKPPTVPNAQSASVPTVKATSEALEILKARHPGKKENELHWIVIKKEICDVTNFASEHPGGEIILEYECNAHAEHGDPSKDATSAFEETGHSKGARKTLSKLVIAKIA